MGSQLKGRPKWSGETLQKCHFYWVQVASFQSRDTDSMPTVRTTSTSRVNSRKMGLPPAHPNRSHHRSISPLFI